MQWKHNLEGSFFSLKLFIFSSELLEVVISSIRILINRRKKQLWSELFRWKNLFKKNQQSKTFVIKGRDQHKWKKTIFGGYLWKACHCSDLLSWNQHQIHRNNEYAGHFCLNTDIHLWKLNDCLPWFIQKCCRYTWKADVQLPATGLFHASCDIYHL